MSPSTQELGATGVDAGNTVAAARELQRLIRQRSQPHIIARFLDALAEPARIAASRSLDRSLQRALWSLVEGFRPVRLTDLVPPSTPELTAVRHYGRNTLPLFTLFEKRFYRGAGVDPNDPRELAGANFQTLQPLTGPGYFTVQEDPARGELLVDYRRVPNAAPVGFAPIAPNKGNRSGLVYGGMVDTLRRVSEYVTIGSAAKRGKDLGSYFTLCRAG
jgi:hypothetical protein